MKLTDMNSTSASYNEQGAAASSPMLLPKPGAALLTLQGLPVMNFQPPKLHFTRKEAAQQTQGVISTGRS